jgi:hypothetical protein
MNTKTKKEEKQDQAIVPVKQDAEALIALAIEKNVPVETMERLLAMRRELKAEYAKAQFDIAMAKFQARCPIIEKNETAGSGGFTYKYTSLDFIVKQIKEILAENGFSYTFDTKKTDKSIVTYCKVKHKDGHMEVSTCEITIDTSSKMNISQKDGAANTYGKRYAFCNAFGILTGDEDTDGMSGNGSQVALPAGNGSNGNGHISPKQEAFIKSLLKKKGYREKDVMIKYEVGGISQLASVQASQIIENLQKLPDMSDADRESEQIANDADKALS